MRENLEKPYDCTALVITKALPSVMAIVLLFAPSLSAAQAPSSSTVKPDGSLSQVTVAPQASESAEIAQKLTNPLATMISIPLQNWFDFNLGPRKDGFRYTLEAQPVYPMQVSKNWNVLSRTTVPIIYQQNVSGRTTQAGLSDSTESLFLSPVHTKSIIWSAGPVFLIPTATNGLLSTRKFAIGPTAVALKHKGHTNVGLLASQVWSLADGFTGFRQMTGSPEFLKERRDGTLPIGKDAPALLAMPGSILTPFNARSVETVTKEIREQKKQGRRLHQGWSGQP